MDPTDRGLARDPLALARVARATGLNIIMGSGYYVDAAISELRLDVAMALILAVAALSMTVDAFSRALRRRLRIEALPTRLSDAPGGMPARSGAPSCA